MDAIDWAHHSDYVWLIAGVCLMALETVGINGIGLVFSGLGAVIVGIVIHYGFVDNGATISQFALFFIATAFWSLALWKPVQKFRAGKRSGNYRNIVGDIAYVGSEGLNKKNGGEVTWSGTIMRAELAPGVAVEFLEAGSNVEVVDVAGATLTVKPKE